MVAYHLFPDHRSSSSFKLVELISLSSDSGDLISRSPNKASCCENFSGELSFLNFLLVFLN